MTTMMSAEIKEVDNGFSLKLDGYIGDKDLVFSSIQEVLKEVSRYWDEHLARFTNARPAVKSGTAEKTVGSASADFNALNAEALRLTLRVRSER